ncbi:MAG: hypothetical protein Q9168_001217 [Polycauliona sp. 1 TL-2023]
MFSLPTILSCLYFALAVVALMPPPPSPGTDPCGPWNHDGDAGTNTCFSAVQPGGPLPYGIVCGADSTVVQSITVDACATSAQKMCNMVAAGGMTTEEWHWTGDTGGPTCRVGVWLSGAETRAPVPNYRRCLNQIMQPLILSCVKRPYNVGTVNIRTLPNTTNVFTGEVVNVGYTAFVVSPTALYHSVDPPATANVFGDPAAGFDQQSIDMRNRLNPTQNNTIAAATAAGAGGQPDLADKNS